MRTQLCVWAGNLEFMSPWQQNPWSCIMDYHWNSTPLPNIMRAQDLIKSAHSVWHKVKKELSLYWGWGWEKPASHARRQAGKQAGGRAGGRLGFDGPSSCRASSLIDGSHIHQWTYRQMALNAWNFQPRKQLFSLTSAVCLTLLSWNIEQRRRMWMVTRCRARRSTIALQGWNRGRGLSWGWGRACWIYIRWHFVILSPPPLSLSLPNFFFFFLVRGSGWHLSLAFT